MPEPQPLRLSAEYSEVDLLVAALRGHIRDLQAERDHLYAEVERLRSELARLSPVAPVARMRPNRSS